MILDLTDVPMFDVTVGLALENAIKDAQEANCAVLILCPNKQTRQQLAKFDLLDMVPKENIYDFRHEALLASLTYVESISNDER